MEVSKRLEVDFQQISIPWKCPKGWKWTSNKFPYHGSVQKVGSWLPTNFHTMEVSKRLEVDFQQISIPWKCPKGWKLTSNKFPYHGSVQKVGSWLPTNFHTNYRRFINSFLFHNAVWDSVDLYWDLLYRHECFTAKYATRKFRTKLHPGYEWHIFHIFTSEDIDDVTSNVFPLKSVVFARVIVYIIKRTSHVGLKIWSLSLVLKTFHSSASLTREVFSPLEDKPHIFAPPCDTVTINGRMETDSLTKRRR